MIPSRGLSLVTGSVLVLSAALASPTRAASATDPEPVCYPDDICLEAGGQSGTDNEGRIIALTRNGVGNVVVSTIDCNDGKVVTITVSRNANVTDQDARQRIEENFGHFCAP